MEMTVPMDNLVTPYDNRKPEVEQVLSRPDMTFRTQVLPYLMLVPGAVLGVAMWLCPQLFGSFLDGFPHGWPSAALIGCSVANGLIFRFSWVKNFQAVALTSEALYIGPKERYVIVPLKNVAKVTEVPRNVGGGRPIRIDFVEPTEFGKWVQFLPVTEAGFESTPGDKRNPVSRRLEAAVEAAKARA